MKLMKVVLAVSALFVFCNISFGQTAATQQGGVERVRPATQQDKQKDYEQGLRDGQEDRKNNRPAHPRRDERPYLEGYRTGYSQSAQSVPERRDQPQNMQHQVSDKAFQEGLRDAQDDRKNNRAARPRRDDRVYLDGYRTGYSQSAHGGPDRRDQPQDMRREVSDKAFQEGLRDAQDDRKNNRAARPRRDDRVYLDGYRTGYSQSVHGGPDRRDQPQNAQREVSDKAFQEGLRDGQDDRKNNRVHRPRRDERGYLEGYRAGYGQPPR